MRIMKVPVVMGTWPRSMLAMFTSCLYVGKQGGICCEGESTETDGHGTMKGEWNENIYSKSWQNLLIIDIKICVLDVLPCCCITIFFFLVIFSS